MTGPGTLLWGWGAQRRVACDVREPESPEEAARLLDARGTISRGLGRSCGDQALNEGRRVLLTRPRRRCPSPPRASPSPSTSPCEKVSRR